MPYITTQDGTAIYYKDWGTGMPVILIHGWPVNADMWEHQACYLTDNGFRVISYDRRGFGRSSQPGGGYDYDTMTSDLSALVDALGLHQVALVGFSMGGGEVARFVAKYPSKVSKAVFVSSVTPYLMKTDDNPDGVDHTVFDGILDNLKKDRPAFLEDFSQKFFGRTMIKHTVSEPTLAWNQGMALMASPLATVATAKSWAGTDFRSDLSSFRVPTLFIHGTSDNTVPIDVSARRAVKLVPGAELLEYDGEPHGLYLTAKDRLNQDLLNFLTNGTVVHGA
jgi:non-heme chloroperoxidase